MGTEPEVVKSGLERTLPSSYYTSEAIFALEEERIFCQDWLCIGREEELPKAGDYLVLGVAGENVLVVRTRGGQLRAFYNVCRHRGSTLCTPSPESKEEMGGPHGTLPGVIRCPYHSWTYSLEGQLINAPYVSTHCEVDKEEFGLYPVGLDSWGGFIFLNLTPGDALERGHTLLRQLGPVPGRLMRYPLRDLRTARRIVYDVRANWKVVVENYNECYHCAGVHPELCEVVPAFKRNFGADLPWEEGIPHREGAWTFTRTGTADRRPFPGLSEEEKVRHKGELIYPNFMLSLSADHAAAFVLWPMASDRTRIVCSFLFHPEEMVRPDFDASDAVEFWDLVNRQDWAICERVQEGSRSRVHRFGYYAPMEDNSLDIRRYITRHLGEPVWE